MHIRRADINDLKAISQLGQTEWGKYEAELSVEHWKTMSATISNEVLYQQLLQQAIGFVCEDAGEIIGMSFLVLSGHPTHIYSEEQSYIRFVTVSEKRKGLKIGQKLTESCIEYAKEQGEKRIALHTSEFMDKARHIYEKLGFVVIRQLEPIYGKKYWLYELNLNP
ncbi:MAG: GNAT family N-acetyltransferase [Cryomorphaceae bacterium]|nr:GNAT family N-acetyltransferase [Cryomorphaceae bacterium]